MFALAKPITTEEQLESVLRDHDRELFGSWLAVGAALQNGVNTGGSSPVSDSPAFFLECLAETVLYLMADADAAKEAGDDRRRNKRLPQLEAMWNLLKGFMGSAVKSGHLAILFQHVAPAPEIVELAKRALTEGQVFLADPDNHQPAAWFAYNVGEAAEIAQKMRSSDIVNAFGPLVDQARDDLAGPPL